MAPKSPESLVRRLVRRASWAVRDRWPSRPVTRTVQGVEMVLPWSHRLPDYARVEPNYGQNLVRLAAALGRADGARLPVLDIGANVGDSTLQILAAVDATVLCVEADDFYLGFLHRNTSEDARVEVEASLLVPEETDAAMAPVRSGGTTHFVAGSSQETAPSVTVDELRRRHPGFDRLRLVKSDTDGYDTTLVPAVARTWSDSRPVLFFEYDHEFTNKAGFDPIRVWSELAALGYTQVVVWDNGGRLLGRHEIAQMPELAAELDRPLAERDFHFWDVAVAHGDDPAGLQALAEV